MMTMTVKAADLARIHNRHRAALGYGMFYRKPYLALDQIVGAEGTVFVLNGHTLVACTMATQNRTIIHTQIPCTDVDTNDGGLFAIEGPKEFDRPLRRFRDKPVKLKLAGDRLELILPRPGNARGMISLPMERVDGHMLSVVCQEPTTTLCLSADLLIAALRRVPRGKPWDLLAIQPTDEGFDFRYAVNGAAASERLPATTLERAGSTSPFVCSARYIAGLVRVLKSLRKHGPKVRVQISTSRIAVWNDSATIQFFADKTPSDWKGPSKPDTNTEIPEIQLILDRRMPDLPKDTGKWLRRLVRDAKANREKTETTWRLTRDLVVVELDCGIQTSIDMPCACDCWPLDQDRLCLTVSPLTTAAILECSEEDKRGCRLAYQHELLTVRSSSRPYQLTASVELNENS